MAAKSTSVIRCAWARSELSIRYHDEEWGVPVHDDRTLFEFLILEGAQAGLSWETILNKREHYRTAFDGFDPSLVVRYDQRKIRQLLRNPGIVRNRLKIASTVQNAKAFLRVQEEFGRFDQYVWKFVGGPLRQMPQTARRINEKSALSPGGPKELFRSKPQVDDLIGRGIRALAGQPGIPSEAEQARPARENLIANRLIVLRSIQRSRIFDLQGAANAHRLRQPTLPMAGLFPDRSQSAERFRPSPPLASQAPIRSYWVDCESSRQTQHNARAATVHPRPRSISTCAVDSDSWLSERCCSLLVQRRRTLSQSETRV